MTNSIPLLMEIDRYLERTGMRPTTFGRRTVGDPHLVDRLRGGGDVKTVTADKIRGFMYAPIPVRPATPHPDKGAA